MEQPCPQCRALVEIADGAEGAVACDACRAREQMPNEPQAAAAVAVPKKKPSFWVSDDEVARRSRSLPGKRVTQTPADQNSSLLDLATIVRESGGSPDSARNIDEDLMRLQAAPLGPRLDALRL